MNVAPRVRDPVSHGPVDDEALAEALTALAYPARLELLDLLRSPKTLGQIRLRPRSGPDGAPEDRPAARPTVLKHLDCLVAARFVDQDTTEQGGRTVPRYEVNATQLYALTEELRRLAVRYAGHGGIGDETGTLGGAQVAEPPRGPRLTLVHGVYEGRAFPLAPGTLQEGGWTLGRARGLPVSLDYDLFVSSKHARIERRDDGFVLHDLGSKNGTRVNWRAMQPGDRVPLQPADIIGVGRSALCFSDR